jgi:hypothetical protein
MGRVAIDPARSADRLSASYLIALGARLVREVGGLLSRARQLDKRLATLAVDAEIRFRSATERAAFTAELTGAINQLVTRYHDADAPDGRSHRLLLMSHPLPQASQAKPSPRPVGQRKPS